MDTLESVFARKNFSNLLHLLYQEKTVRQKDIAEALGISKGVVCLNMNELDALGFIQQQKEGRCKTYRLLEKGAAYYETNYLPAAPPEPNPLTRPEEAGRLQDSLSNLLTKLNRSLAEVEELAKALRAQQDTGPQCPVKHGRHFDTILGLLYREKTMLKKDLAEKLGISMNNTFLHVKDLIEAGYVEQGRDGISRTYRLSPAGERYCAERNLTPCEKPEPSRPEKSPRPIPVKQPETVLNEKNFSSIMRVLYETGDIPLSDLCARLNRPHGNMYRDMQNLTLEGFVKKETVKHCNFYALSDKGRRYCEQYFAE